MKKVLKVTDLDCAHCAGKIEKEIQNLEGVKNANVSFLLQKITIEADDDKMEDIIKETVKIASKIEPDCTIVL